MNTYVDRFLHEKQARRKLIGVLVVLALLVVFGVFWQLKVTGVAMTNEVNCGMEEHVHSVEAGCYEQVLVCGMTENTSVAETGHVHTDACYKEVLVCELPEHTHTVECLADDTADVESLSDWENTLPDKDELSGVWAEDVVAVAESQIGYTESTANFKLDEDGVTHRGYTRYGAWYGNEYGTWDAMFAAFCLHYAGVSDEDFPVNSSAYAWTVSLEKTGQYQDSESYVPAPGDIVFLDSSGDERADTVGVVCEVEINSDQLLQMTVVLGDCNDSVEELVFAVDRAENSVTEVINQNKENEAESLWIMGYGVLTEQTSVADANGRSDVTTIDDEENQGEDSVPNGTEQNDEDEQYIEVKGSTEADGLYLRILAEGDYEYYTGETGSITISIGNESDAEASNESIRVYIQYTEAGGTGVGYKEGKSQEFKTNKTDEDGNTIYITGEVIYLGDGLWCFSFSGDEVAPGVSVSIDLSVSYPSPTSGGGDVYVYGEIVNKTDEDEDKSYYYPSEEVTHDYYKLTFSTVPGTPEITKTALDGAHFVGDGTSSGTVYVAGLAYSIQAELNREVPEEETIGDDYAKKATFTDVLTLPEGLSWREGLIEAISSEGSKAIETRSVSSSESLSGADAQQIIVTINGKEYILCEVNVGATDGESLTASVVKNEDGESEIVISWIKTNTVSDAEITLPVYTITFGSDVIVGDTDELIGSEESSEEKTYTFNNSIDMLVDFSYSKEKHVTDTAEKSIAIGNGSLTLNKTSATISGKQNGSSTSSTNVYAGSTLEFTVTAENPDAGEYKGLQYITDNLGQFMYLTPDQMQTMFEAEENKETEGHLTITLTNASLYNQVEETVTTTDREEESINEAYQGTQNHYDGKYGDTENEKDESLITSTATITFSLNDSGILTMTVSGVDDKDNSNESLNGDYLIGEGQQYSSIEAALDAIGYVVTYAVQYSAVWDLGEDYTLYGGHTVTYTYQATVKNTFQLLTGDRDWYYSNDHVSSGTLNTALAQSEPGEEYLANSTVGSRNIYRDFRLGKRVESIYRYGDDVDTSGEVQYNDVISYSLVITHSGPESFSALPLVDEMSGGQILLVPVEENTGLADKELGIVEVDGTKYYILSTAGTYEDVVVNSDGTVADKVEVSVSEDGSVSTLIYFYMSINENGVNENGVVRYVNYLALVQPVDADIEGAAFNLENEAWLNDHETHRLYDEVGLNGTLLQISKDIVSDFGSDKDNPGDDTLVKRTVLADGDKVTYLLTLNASGEGYVTVNGSNIYDVLPETISSYPWTSGNVSVKFIAGSDLELSEGSTSDSLLAEWSKAGSKEGETGWYITSENPDEENLGSSDSETQYYLRWTEDLSISFHGTLYIYVTLQMPTGDEWTQYSEAFASEDLENTLHVFQLYDTVYHNVEVTSSAYLQKGVYRIGVLKPEGGAAFSAYDESELTYYLNNSGYYSQGCVQYYVALYNKGPNNLYLNAMQDVLPEGFTHYYSTSSTSLRPACVTNFSFTDNDGEEMDVSCKQFNISVTTDTADNGRQRVTFNLSATGTSSNDLQYDESMEMYYLAPGEAAVFTYYVLTNDYDSTEDVAENIVAMPFYDYTGGGVQVSDEIEAGWSGDNGIHNSGDCSVDAANVVESYGINASSGENDWLTSNVTVTRSNIIPGITKTVEKSTLSATEDAVWNVLVTNSGKTTMSGYTITDVMQSPYTFTGDVTATTNQGDLGDSSSTYTLFSFVDNDSEDEVSIQYKYTNTNSRTVKLTVGGDPVEITAYLSGVIKITFAISVDVDEDGNEVLKITILDDEYGCLSIQPGGSITFSFTTSPDVYEHANAVYYNSAYITPNQEFSDNSVTQGTTVDAEESEYVNGHSVRSSAQISVSYGDATTSSKSVWEAEDESNYGTSENVLSEGNKITLSDDSSGFWYELDIHNGSDDSHNSAVDKLVVIDNLPETNDTYTFGNLERDSQFKVDFAEDPRFTVWITYTENGEEVRENLTSGTDYTLEYSSKTSFTDADWNGTAVEDWSSELTGNARSFRIVFNLDNKNIPSGATVHIRFMAIINTDDGEVKPGAIAWNSFGYSYEFSGSSAMLQASPMAVGVQVPVVPVLQKQLESGGGQSTVAAADESFTYVIYPGTEVVTGWADLNELLGALASNGIETYTTVTVEVPAGESCSEEKLLSDLKEYSADAAAGDTDPVGDWVWKDGASYTIVEVSTEGEYEFSAWNTTTHANAYSFTYHDNIVVMLINTNKTGYIGINLEKVDAASGDKLDGAIFTLTKDVSGQVFYYGESAQGVLEWQTPSSGESIPTITLGELSVNNVEDGTYTLTEVAAPEGYNVLSSPVVFTVTDGNVLLAEGTDSNVASLTYSSGVVTISVKDKSGAILPKTGGIGTDVFMACGVMLLVAAASGLVLQNGKRKRKTQN